MIQKRKVRFLDTTLRDGLQSPSVHFQDKAKIELACALERAGIDVIEAGFPSSSKNQFDVMDAICGEVKCTVAAMARMNEKDIAICAQALRRSSSGCIHISVPASRYLRESKTGLDKSSTISLALKSLNLIKSYGYIAEVGIEDAGRTEYSFVEELCMTLSNGGADIINIADTSGFMQTDEFASLVKNLYLSIPRFNSGESIMSVHCHNDFGLAVANTLAGVYNGAGQVETTIGGVGERSGNAQFEAVYAALEERADYYNAETSIVKGYVAELYSVFRNNFCGSVSDSVPLSGRNSFLHSSGIHQKALAKDKKSYSIINPEDYGFEKDRFVLTVFSGSGAFILYVRELCGCEIDADSASIYIAELKEEYNSKGILSATDILCFLANKGLYTGEIWFLDSLKYSEENSIIYLEAGLNSNKSSFKKTSASGSDIAEVSASIIKELFNEDLSVIQFRIDSSGNSIANIFRCDIKASYDGCMFYSSQTSGSISQSVIVAFLDIHNQIRGRYE